MKPNLLLLGAQKSASTYLSAWLSKHPQIHIQSKEHILFEDPEYAEFDETKLDLPLEEDVYGIRRPDYFGNPKYHKRLERHLPEAKIIIVLRNPAERAISAFYHYMKYGMIKPEPPEVLIDLVNEENKHPAVSAYKQIIDYGRYSTLYKKLLQYYDANQILLLRQADLIGEKMDDLYKEVCDFLGIAKVVPPVPDIIPQTSTYNYKAMFFVWLGRNIKFRYDENYSKAYTINHSEIPLKDRAILSLLARGKNIWLKFDKKKDAISSEIYNSLIDYYREEIIELERLTDLDLQHWLQLKTE